MFVVSSGSKKRDVDELEDLRQKIAELDALVRHTRADQTQEQSYRRYKLERYASEGFGVVLELLEEKLFFKGRMSRMYAQELALLCAEALRAAGCLALIQAGVDAENRALALEREKRKINASKPPLIAAAKPLKKPR